MKYRPITILLLLVIVAVLIVYDIYVAVFGEPGSTISSVVYMTSSRHPWVAFLAGFLCGHLFWRMKDLPTDAPNGKV